MSCSDEQNPAFIGSLGIVRRYVDETEEWLTIWDEIEEVCKLIQADRTEEETFRDCLHKNLEAELSLNAKKDYIISGLSMAHHQAPIEWPGEETPQWVIVQFFPIQIYGQAARDKVDRLPNVQWLTLSEIAKGCSTEGKPFDEKQRLLIERADLIPAYLK